MVKVSVILLTSFLVGCCEPVVKYEPIEVVIPVKAKCPEPKSIPKPNLPVNELSEEDIGDHEKVATQYAASLVMCMGYAEQQEVILESYRKEIEDAKKEEE